jgi:hypothetical protein
MSQRYQHIGPLGRGSRHINLVLPGRVSESIAAELSQRVRESGGC